MKLLTVMGLFLDLVGVVILGMGEVMQGAAAALTRRRQGGSGLWGVRVPEEREK